MENWFVVAISGVTCGGKTTLTKKLTENLPYPVVPTYQDDYFLVPEDSDKHIIIDELNHANWDILSSVEFDKMVNNIKNIQTTLPEKVPGIILLDGNLILNFSPIEQLCNKKYYIVLNKEECWARRQVRVYQPPDPPGYFEKCAWPMYEMYRNKVEETVQNIDGNEDPEQLYHKVYDSILFSVQQFTNTSCGTFIVDGRES